METPFGAHGAKAPGREIGIGIPPPPRIGCPRHEESGDGSRFASWLRKKKKSLFPPDPDPGFIRKVEALRQQPDHAALLEGWTLTNQVFNRRDLPPIFEDALQYTRFAMEQFKQRADRDHVKLVPCNSRFATET